MSQIFNVYCDESCHLENDNQQVMVLGAVWCPLEKTNEINTRLREIKLKHGLRTQFETKWTKVSPAKEQFYLNLMDYFFDDDDLHFRVLIVPNKSKLEHEIYQQTHDTWYYKMYFTMLKTILNPQSRYRIYIDIKDTKGAGKVAKMHDILSNNMFDFSKQIIERIQLVRSHELEILQIADLLIGTVSYLNRYLDSSSAKNSLVKRMQERSKYSLVKTTLPQEDKVNILRWQASEPQLQ